jgi:hypothetical protein
MAKIGRPITLPGPIGELAHKVGGVAQLSDSLGVHVRTVRRWAHGGPILPMPQKMLLMLFEKHEVDPGDFMG